VEQYQRYQRAK
jgi:NADH-quinone oxidoreductase subunit A